ncbi:MAG TPA: M56 family metallopeptidase, partial [Bryobacteraceae bacterium]|nr:M56 family metallopeptidase [Bryobacteraceae bacterium]
MRETFIESAGWALIHSLWQSAAIAAIWGTFNLALRRASANTRYLLAYLALLAMPIAGISGFISLAQHDEPVVAVGTWAPIGAVTPVAIRQSAGLAPAAPPPYLGMVVWLWLSGVMAMSVWSAAGWVAAQRLKRRSTKAFPEAWQRRLRVLANRLAIRRTVRLCESALARVPAVIGWLRPVILVPAGALANLSPEELEAVLAHELAHVRRLDYVANLLQSAIEIVMFYHPAVWWLSKRVRAERENCCDDLAVAACGNRVIYARALTALEEFRSARPQFMMAATGGPLVTRIRRLLGHDEPRRRSLPVWAALATS